MPESIAQRYRTRFPPKEHEEAVRMLLEGVEKQKVEEAVNGGKSWRANQPVERTTLSSNHRQQKRQPFNEDRKSLNSASTATETNSSSGIVDYQNEDSQNDDSPAHGYGAATSSMQSKSTSTSESMSTKSAECISERSVEEAAAIQSPASDLIPSRTIAVQCDLKWSSVKARDAMFDTSMQASSISSTRYGFYNYNHETLAKRQRLQRSTSYRNLDMNGNEPHDATRTSAGQKQGQQLSNEAPTSMSELSESDVSNRASDDENIVPRTSVHTSKHSSNKHLDSVQSDERQPSRELHQVNRLSARGRQMYGSVLDNSVSTARARIDSLPRRPMTALSYVSSNKLRHQQQDQSDSESADEEDMSSRGDARRNASKMRKYNSVSHQNLVRPKTPAPDNNYRLSSSNASSDSELNRAAGRTGSKARPSYNRQHVEDEDHHEQENRRSEEVVLDSVRVAALAPAAAAAAAAAASVINQRPKLVEARHQEEVQDLNGMLEQFRRAESELRNNGSTYRTKYSTLGPAAGAPSAAIRKEVGKDQGRYMAGSTMSLSRKANRKSQQLVEQQNADSTTAVSRRRPITDCMPRGDLRESSSSSLSTRGYDRQVARSTSMRQQASNRPATLARSHDRQQRQLDDDDEEEEEEEYRYQPATSTTIARNRSQTMRPLSGARRQVNELDSETLESKNWSNPAAGVSFRTRSSRREQQQAPASDELVGGQRNVPGARRAAARSMSMRDVNERYTSGYTPYRSNANFAAKYNDEYSSSESSDLAAANENVIRNLATRLSPLDYDSQQKLNESGLPEVCEPTSAARATSYLGGARGYQQQQHHLSQDGLQQQQQQQRFNSNTLNGRGGQIKGRAMSQQSLTRPTMPLTSGSTGRRWQTAGSNSAASDVGGSSMSLATRLHGRYESAHTRTPIVMYIPPASSSRASSLKGEDSLLGGGGGSGGSRLQRSTLRTKGSRSPRARSRHGSQDRSSALLSRRQRSVSRNGSDSESSSILRSIVRSRRDSAYSSKRIARMQNIPVNNMIDSGDEDMDGVGRLATEVDSYKFSRRYSVPKDAKINWFARLRNRVASNNR